IRESLRLLRGFYQDRLRESPDDGRVTEALQEVERRLLIGPVERASKLDALVRSDRTSPCSGPLTRCFHSRALASSCSAQATVTNSGGLDRFCAHCVVGLERPEGI